MVARCGRRLRAPNTLGKIRALTWQRCVSTSTHCCRFIVCDALCRNVFVGVADQRAENDGRCIDDFCRLWAEKPGVNPPSAPNAAPKSCPYRDHVLIEYMNVSESKGPCIARARTQQLLPRDESLLPDFCLQTDSHMLFVNQWDVELQREWLAAGNEFAVLSTYAAKLEDLQEDGEWRLTDDVPHICRTMWGGHGLVRNTVAASAYFLPKPKLNNLWGAGLSYAKVNFHRIVYFVA